MDIIKIAEIADSDCDLCGLPAVDCIIQYMGYTKNEVEQEVIDELCIMICEPCSKMMTSGLWVLLYCANCLDFRFVYKARARRTYDSDFQLLKRCPACVESV